MKRLSVIVFVCVLSLIMPLTAVAQAPDQPPIVQAILFYSPSCPHCHTVIDRVLPPLANQYGDQLQVLGIDTSQAIGGALYQATIEHFNISAQRRGVPTMVIGEVVLVGGLEIPEQLPGIIEAGLAAGGVGWPEIPGLLEAAPNLPPSADPAKVQVAPTAVPVPIIAVEPAATLDLDAIDTSNMAEAAVTAAPSDPVGMVVGWLVLFGLLGALFYGLWRSIRAMPGISDRLSDPEARLVRTPVVPILAVVGLVVALYLSYVEVNQVTAVCGPIGYCNLVQSSPYAQIMGLPVALLGVASYLAIGGLWLWQRPLNDKFNNLGVYGLLVLTFVGTLFSIYLTILELVVIEAVCAWCLTSAIVTALLFVVVVTRLTERPSVDQTGSLASA
jgi:uncharacterized membrane protein/thiol-disulfide isomerase/thioredoxin